MENRTPTRTPFDYINSQWQRILAFEPAGGIIIVVFAALAMILANSPFAGAYDKFLHFHVSFALGPAHFDQSFQHFVNDALMAIFFLLIGLEIKREFIAGELSSFGRAILPFVAAVGGMAVPALIYTSFNIGTDAMRGWAIPAATDIAFAIGILAILGSRVPVALRVLLVAIAVIDDLGAILIIALFYTESLSPVGLTGIAVCVAILLAFNLSGVRKTSAYVIVGLVLWYFVYLSGLHATLAGVMLGFLIPYRTRTADSPLERWEHSIVNWSTFLILPLFAFCNAGVSFAGLTPAMVFSPVSLGIAAGLFIGKQIGIFTTLAFMIRTGISSMPKNANWAQLYAVALLCGIGFTMSLFIGNLAFAGMAMDAPVRVGVLGGSIVAAITGYLLMRFASRKPAQT